MDYIISRLECEKLKVNKDVSFYRLICSIQDTSKKNKFFKNITTDFTIQRLREINKETGIDMAQELIDAILDQATNKIFDYAYPSEPYETWKNIRTELLNNHKDLIMKVWEDIEKYILEEPKNVE